MAMMDGTWYECSSPDVKNKKDFDMIKNDFITFLHRSNNYNQQKLCEDFYIIILEKTIYKKFYKNSCSWRGYAVFKNDIMLETKKQLDENISKILRIERPVRCYIDKFMKRHYCPPKDDFQGGKGYLKLKNETLVGSKAYL